MSIQQPISSQAAVSQPPASTPAEDTEEAHTREHSSLLCRGTMLSTPNDIVHFITLEKNEQERKREGERERQRDEERKTGERGERERERERGGEIKKERRSQSVRQSSRNPSVFQFARVCSVEFNRRLL